MVAGPAMYRYRMKKEAELYNSIRAKDWREQHPEYAKEYRRAHPEEMSQVKFRLSRELHERLLKSAKANGRSLCKEISHRLSINDR